MSSAALIGDHRHDITHAYGSYFAIVYSTISRFVSFFAHLFSPVKGQFMKSDKLGSISTVEGDGVFTLEGAGVALSLPNRAPIWLHPLWLRERCRGAGMVDPVNGQRLYDPSKVPASLSVGTVQQVREDTITVSFSDGAEGEIVVSALHVELGLMPDPQSPPPPHLWTAATAPVVNVDWASLDKPHGLKAALDIFFRFGFCIFQNTPTEPEMLRALARRFGYVRETNFGTLFDVINKPDANDIAYTKNALVAHTDNPYREPVPGIQFLHCLENSVAGGLSTLVDGFAIVERLIEEAPQEAAILEKTAVRFRYEAVGGSIVQNTAPIIERDVDGRLKRVNLSSRLDYVPLLMGADMDKFYAGRRRLQAYADDPQFELRSTFLPGTLLMMDNYRTLHGRTSYEGDAGHRHLQGCYIDHDGPDGLYRVLARDGVGEVRRDVA